MTGRSRSGDGPSAEAIQQEIARRMSRECTCALAVGRSITDWCTACLLRAASPAPLGLEALVAEIRERQRQNEESRVWACQCESRWHADEYRDWADRLESVLRAPAARSGGEK